MDYEQKYKEALGWMQSLYKGLHGATKEDAEHYFPELKESENEKNIKDLIDELKCSLRAANCQNYACGEGHEKRIALLKWGIAWLEKQKGKLDADEVIEWLERNATLFGANWCHTENIIEQFKEDFGI